VEESAGVQQGKAITTAWERYTDATKLRATIQAIPYVGGPLDTLLAGKGSEIQRSRVEAFLHGLDARLNRVEQAEVLQADEGFFDFMVLVFEKVARARSEGNICRFTNVVANQVVDRKPWEEADAVASLLADLSDIHIDVLLAVMDAPQQGEPFSGQKVATLLRSRGDRDAKAAALPLAEKFPGYDVAVLRMACSELIAKGLLHDEGVGRLNTKAMEFFISTDLADWFVAWIRDKSGNPVNRPNEIREQGLPLHLPRRGAPGLRRHLGVPRLREKTGQGHLRL